ncbi:zinc finger protein 568-like [Conger conger]|uniref:zinc finger protein 568-like n=1 Tax=Conger conger TaxID=82655 RepID=UPI002A59FA95|nr:zinc finger protein 568-like [Conger conger]
MSNSAVFQTQLASVIDTMAKTAMTEIIKLVDDYSAILRWEMYRSQNENEGLKKKIEVMENERLTPRDSVAGARDGSGNGRSPGTLISDPSRGQDGGNSILYPRNGFANRDCDARGDGERTYEPAPHKDEPPSDPERLVIKQEGPEEAGRASHPRAREGEQQGALQCPALPVARRRAPGQHCEECDAPAEGADEQPRPHRTQLSLQSPGLCEESGRGAGSGFLSYDGAVGRCSHTDTDELPLCYTPHQQGALLQYEPAGDQASLNPGSADPNPDPPGKSLRGETALSCMYCGKSFPYLSYLKRHISNHTGERPHRCAQCGRCFIRRSHLVRHQQVHTGVKPFDCALCGRKFARLSHLDRHLSTHV